jgi:hypothetical protein
MDREPPDFFLDRSAIEHQHVWHEHRIGHAVMSAMECADRMR